jgi:hypothetical protein
MPGIYFGKMEQKNSIDWLIEKCAYSDLRPELWEIIKQQAREMYNKEIEESYQDGKEIGTIETLLKNKNL